jgi:hypothetical protein
MGSLRLRKGIIAIGLAVGLSALGITIYSISANHKIMAKNTNINKVNPIERNIASNSNDKRMVSSASFLPMDNAEMTKRASLIIVGTIKDVRPAYKGLGMARETKDKLSGKGMTQKQIDIMEKGQAKLIWTDVVIDVEQYKKSDMLANKTKKEIVMRTRGGSVDGETLTAEGFYSFDKKDIGQRCLLFLGRVYDDALEPFTQGTFRIEGDNLVNDCFPNYNTTVSAMFDTIDKNISEVQ